MRWCRNERGLVDGTTIRDYEYTLARMALTLADLEPQDVTIDDLRTVIDVWAEREPRTRKKVTSAIRSSGSGPRTRAMWSTRRRRGFARRRSRIAPLTSCRWPWIRSSSPQRRPPATDWPSSSFSIYGLRKSELTGIQVRDFDLGRRTLTIFGKGQKERVLPLRGRLILACEEYLLTPLRGLERPPEPDDYCSIPSAETSTPSPGRSPKSA